MKICRCQNLCIINASSLWARCHWDLFVLSNGQYRLLAERTSLLSSRGLGLPYLWMCCDSRAACELSKNINLANTATHQRAACKAYFEGLWVLKHVLHSGLPAQRAVPLGAQPTSLKANLLLCHFWQRDAAFGRVWRARLETLGSTGHRDVVCLTPGKLDLLLLVLPSLAELQMVLSSMDCTFSTHACSSFSECLSSAQQMPRDICVSRRRLAVFRFRPKPAIRASELQDCSITGHEETSATDWKLKE